MELLLLVNMGVSCQARRKYTATTSLILDRMKFECCRQASARERQAGFFWVEHSPLRGYVPVLLVSSLTGLDSVSFLNKSNTIFSCLV